MPDDPIDLLDRPEYWTVQNDVAKDYEPQDEICFFLNSEGKIYRRKIFKRFLLSSRCWIDVKAVITYFHLLLQGRLQR